MQSLYKFTEKKECFFELIKEFNGTCPSPSPSDVHQGHYKTLIEMLRTRKNTNNTFNPLGFECCTKGCNYIFFSTADFKRHERLMKH